MWRRNHRRSGGNPHDDIVIICDHHGNVTIERKAEMRVSDLKRKVREKIGIVDFELLCKDKDNERLFRTKHTKHIIQSNEVKFFMIQHDSPHETLLNIKTNSTNLTER